MEISGCDVGFEWDEGLLIVNYVFRGNRSVGMGREGLLGCSPRLLFGIYSCVGFRSSSTDS